MYGYDGRDKWNLFFQWNDKFKRWRAFFLYFLEEVQKQLGVDDVSALALIILGQPLQTTRAKPVGTTKGTSILSANLCVWLKFRVNRWPTLTTERIKK